MQYKAETPQAYMSVIEDDWRGDIIQEIRTLITKNRSNIHETIEYHMLAYQYHEQTIFHLNAQRAYVSLYIGNIDKVDGMREMLNEFDCGKGCIRIKKWTVIADTNLDVCIKKMIAVWDNRGEINC